MIKSVTWVRLGLGLILAIAMLNHTLGQPDSDPTQRPPPARIPIVDTQPIRNQTHRGSLVVYGQIKAVDTVNWIAAVPGVIQPTRVQFQAGIPFKKGDILIAIDNREQRYQLNAATSAFMTRIIQLIAELDIDYPDQAPPWRQFLSQIQLDHPLPELPNSDTRIHYRLAALGILSDYYAIQKQAVVLEKYTLMAPFDGAVKTSAVRQTKTDQPARTPGISTQTNQTTQTTETIQQTLFAGLTGITQWRKNKSLADLTQLQAEQVLETTLYTTTLAFYDLVETQYRLAVAESVVALSEDRLNRVRIRAGLGGESQLAVLNATVDLNTDKTEYQNALAARKAAEIQLNQQLNQALDTPLTAELPPPLSVTTSGIRQNRAIRIAEQSHRLSQLDKQLVLGALFPSITVRHTMQDTREPINTLEAQLSFTGWRHKQAWDDATLTHAETNLNRARVRQLVQAQWAQALVDYDRTRTLQAHELETVRVAKRNFDRTQALFHAGQVSALVFRDAQLKYTQSQYRAHQAQIQLGKAIARVHQLAEAGEFIFFYFF